MKKFLKWTAIGLGIVLLLVIFNNQEKQEQYWTMLFVGLGWLGYSIATKMDKHHLENKELLTRIEEHLYTMRRNQDAA